MCLRRCADEELRCTCGVVFCYVCGSSKKTELGQCKCSYPNMQREEPIENPMSDEEGIAINDQDGEEIVEHRERLVLAEERPILARDQVVDVIEWQERWM